MLRFNEPAQEKLLSALDVQRVKMGIFGDTSVMNSARIEDRPNYVFIASVKPGVKDRDAQTVIRRHVMRDIGKA